MTYDAGFTETGSYPDVIPAGVRRAANMEVCAEFLTRDKTGLASRLLGDGTETMLTPIQRMNALDRVLASFRDR